MSSNKKRIVLLDTVRGLLLLFVIWFHLSYDLNDIFGVHLDYMTWQETYIFRDCFVGLLILISGICCNLTHSNLLRGVKTLGWGMVITVVTAWMMPGELIIFGILHFFGVSMMIYGVLEWCGRVLQGTGVLKEQYCGVSTALIKKCLFVGLAVVSVLLFILTRNWYELNTVELLGGWTKNSPWKYLLFFLGFDTGCTSADYYPLIPWLFLFLTGAFLGKDIKKKKLWEGFYKDVCRPVTWIGQHTLWIYLIHQPVVYGVLYVWFEIMH